MKSWCRMKRWRECRCILQFRNRDGRSCGVAITRVTQVCDDLIDALTRRCRCGVVGGCASLRADDAVSCRPGQFSFVRELIQFIVFTVVCCQCDLDCGTSGYRNTNRFDLDSRDAWFDAGHIQRKSVLRGDGYVCMIIVESGGDGDGVLSGVALLT